MPEANIVCAICRRKFLKTSNNQKCCKACKKEFNKKYRREYHKREYIILREKKRRKTKDYKLKKSKNNKRYCLKNQKKLKQYFKIYYQENKEKIYLRVKKWVLDNPEKARISGRNRSNRRRAVKIKAIGSHTEQEWQQKKKDYNYSCAYCGIQEKDLKKKYKLKYQQILHKDHFFPLTKNGTDYIDNIRPACVSCNTGKNNKIF